VLHGLGAATAGRLGIVELQLSISHSEHYAVGNAIAIVA
jgi:phosphopantetheinyl transferase (holo-ACP synthase)